MIIFICIWLFPKLGGKQSIRKDKEEYQQIFEQKIYFLKMVIFLAIIYFFMNLNAFICLLKSKSNLNLRYLFLTFLLVVLIIDFASVNYYSKHIYIVLAMSSIFANLKIKTSDYKIKGKN